MILVTGATGQIGKATIDFLLKKGVSASHISALVRDEAKAADLTEKGITIKIGDYGNYDSLTAAFKHTENVLLVSSSDVLDKREKQHANAVNAAKEAGVKHIFYTSFEYKDETESSPNAALVRSHIDTENLIKASGLPYTIFRNNFYLDYLPMLLGENVLQTGILLPAGNGTFALALRDEMAEATANVLISEGHENKVYYFSNTENVSLQDVALTLSEVIGKEVRYVNPSTEEFLAATAKWETPAGFGNMYVGFAEAIKHGEYSSERTDLETILGRKPTSAKEFLTRIYAA